MPLYLPTSGSGSASAVVGKRWRSGSQTIGTFGEVALNTDSFLYGSMTASGNGIAVPLDGLYLCIAAIDVLADGGGGGGVRNGIFTVGGTSVQEFGLSVASGEVRLSATALIPLTAADVVGLSLFQNGSPGDVGGSAEKDTSLTVRYLSEAA